MTTTDDRRTRLTKIRRDCSRILPEVAPSPLAVLCASIIELAELMLEDTPPGPVPPAGVHVEPADRTHGVNVAVGQVIEHSRLLDAVAPDVVVSNGPAEAHTYFRRTRQRPGGVPRKWQPCDENGVIRPHAGWPDGFDSDQLFLPATVVKLPTQVIS
ncbi:hypothetical protein SEA_TARDUS_82 [Gordonia phage Tardus]|uniref:Uncharacterized protein n=2 Tax=Zitchvirus TaxID=2948963 RepID=A0A514DHZ0_9CAUD|nr:hypothetical protein J1775_gp79 [Gordonia phage Zipp]QDH93232.1 hypothetical protein SEA_ZIPP_79 [Gordonia phage Zipp]URC17697.1 hypothetical protein SEA_TARDUS_82 [Gordonia phage Tardus]